MTATIQLARHGAHGDLGRVLTGRGDGGPLTAEGRAQAAWLGGAVVQHGPVAAIHASPRARAQETARIAAHRLDVPVETVDALDEIDFGAWTGLAFDALDGDADWRRWNRARATATTPGGETMAAATARAVAHVDGIARAGLGSVLCVTHGDVIRGVVAHYLGLGLDCFDRFDVDPGSVSTLLVGDRGGRVIALNRTRPCTG